MRRYVVLPVILGAAVFLGLSSAAASAAVNIQDGSGAQGSRWQRSVVRLTVDDSVDGVDPAALEALVGAVTVWQNVDTELPTLVVTRGEAGKIGYHSKRPNTNSVVFVADGYAAAKGALAITVTTFDAERGEILDADILLNGEHKFAMMGSGSDAADAYDLQNVLTHEVGHFLGLGEDYGDENATMFAFSRPGEMGKRELAPTDTENLSGLYHDNPGAAQRADCAASVTANPSRKAYGWMWLGFLLLIGLFQARRRALRAAAFSVVSATGVLLAASLPESSVPQGTVAALAARWESGLIVTTAQLTPEGCSTCPPVSIDVLGGRVGNIEQRFGMLRPLVVGDRVALPEPHEGGEVARLYHLPPSEHSPR